MVKKTFFAKVHCIIYLKVPMSKDLYLHESEEVFLALVKTCKAEQDEYGCWKYSNLGGFEFIDLATIRHQKKGRLIISYFSLSLPFGPSRLYDFWTYAM